MFRRAVSICLGAALLTPACRAEYPGCSWKESTGTVDCTGAYLQNNQPIEYDLAPLQGKTHYANHSNLGGGSSAPEYYYVFRIGEDVPKVDVPQECQGTGYTPAMAWQITADGQNCWRIAGSASGQSQVHKTAPITANDVSQGVYFTMSPGEADGCQGSTGRTLSLQLMCAPKDDLDFLQEVNEPSACHYILDILSDYGCPTLCPKDSKSNRYCSEQGSCIVSERGWDSSSKNIVGELTCDCDQSGETKWTGKNCNVKCPEAEKCNFEHGKCTISGDGKSSTCECYDGYTGPKCDELDRLPSEQDCTFKQGQTPTDITCAKYTYKEEGREGRAPVEYTTKFLQGVTYTASHKPSPNGDSPYKYVFRIGEDVPSDDANLPSMCRTTTGKDPTVKSTGEVAAYQIYSNEAGAPLACYRVAGSVMDPDNVITGPIFSDDTSKGLSFTVTGGDICCSCSEPSCPCERRDEGQRWKLRSFRVILDCSTDSEAMRQIVDEEVTEEKVCDYEVRVKSQYGCPYQCAEESGDTINMCTGKGSCTLDPLTEKPVCACAEGTGAQVGPFCEYKCPACVHGHCDTSPEGKSAECYCNSGYTGALCDIKVTAPPTEAPSGSTAALDATSWILAVIAILAMLGLWVWHRRRIGEPICCCGGGAEDSDGFLSNEGYDKMSTTL